MPARTCSKCGEEKLEEDFSWQNKSTGLRLRQCKECCKEKSRLWREKNPDKAKASMENWRKGNWDKVLESSKRQYEAHKKKKLAKQKERRDENPELFRERVRSSYRKNPHIAVQGCAKRKAVKLNATPAWSDSTACKSLYAEARRKTKETGIPHEVDHIYPLQGKAVSGLHVPENLRVATRTENRRKHNSLLTKCGDYHA